jgi:hypothetical protein
MLQHAMEQTASLINTTRNDDGDQILSSTQDFKCRFRWITELDGVSNREEMRSDALLWVQPSTDIKEDNIIKFDGDNFRVRKVTQARRLRGNKVYFLKCLLDKYTSGI